MWPVTKFGFKVLLQENFLQHLLATTRLMGHLFLLGPQLLLIMNSQYQHTHGIFLLIILAQLAQLARLG